MFKRFNFKAVLVGMLTFLALPSGQAQVGLPCEACPSGPTGTGVSPGIVVRRAIDNSIIGSTEVVLPCEQLRVDTDVAYKLPSGGTVFAGFVGTSAELFVSNGGPNTSLGSVAPLDIGIIRVGPAGAPCAETDDLILIPQNYDIQPADAGTTLQFTLQFAGVASQTGCANDVTGSAQITVLVGTCNDNNPCTIDTCIPGVPATETEPPQPARCLNSPINCGDNNPCTADSCNAAAPAGTDPCVHIIVICNDNNACTTDSCVETPIVGNPFGASTVTCSNVQVTCPGDANPCTEVVCTPAGGCSNVAVTCNDNNACTTDTCVEAPIPGAPNGQTDVTCQFQQVTCQPDANPCTEVVCTPAGGCANVAVTCNDNNACTTDTCVEAPIPGAANGQTDVTCQFQQVTCQTDANPCTEVVCTPAGGCANVAVSCDDQNACTIDTCVETPIPGSANGQTDVTCTRTDVVCEDNNACTINRCLPATGCDFTQFVTCQPDANPCTEVVCTPAGGCANVAVSCDDQNACTIDTCVETPIPGGPNGQTDVTCTRIDVVCDDNNACTINRCLPATGCDFTQFVTCVGDANPCTEVVCTPAGGCANVAVTCNDNNACTTDTCVEAPIPGAPNGQTDVTCQFQQVTCQTDANPCTEVVCTPDGGCANVAVSCDDQNACTIDTCVETPIPGSANGQTDVTCTRTDVVCDDNNACTVNRCLPATGCDFTQFVTCQPDANPCTEVVCTPAGGCANVAVTCNDNNACTTDTCVEAPISGAPNGQTDVTCQFQQITCQGDANPCTEVVCTPAGGCANVAVTCNDNNACTTDTCVEAPIPGAPNGQTDVTCQFQQVTCQADANPCTEVVCTPAGGCANVAVSCDDQNACTIDTCVETPIPGSANGQTDVTCTRTDVVCDDNNACTVNRCLPATGCDFTQMVTCQPDANPCTEVVCTPAGGCANVAISCDDQNACTIDTCVETPIPGAPNGQTDVTCTRTDMVCDDNNACTVNRCLPATGCDFTQMVTCTGDANPCTEVVCTPAGGCANVAVTCNDNNACTTDTCVEAAIPGAPNGQTDVTCQFQQVTCQGDANPCTQVVCTPAGGCANVAVPCVSDNNPCTAERCAEVPSGGNGQTIVTCEHDLVPCVPDNDPCTEHRCVESPLIGGNGQSTVTCEVIQLECVPTLTVGKEIACDLGGTCGTFGPVAIGVKAGANCPAFCYRIVITNTSPTVAITSLNVVDNVLGNLSSMFGVSAGTPLAPGASTQPVFITDRAHCANTTNTVTARGTSALGVSSLPARASAVAFVQSMGIACSLNLYSAFDMDSEPGGVDQAGNPILGDNHVTLPSDGGQVQATVTLMNTGNTDLVVTDLDVPEGLVDCETGLPVDIASYGLPLSIPANGSIDVFLGCLAITCPGAEFDVIAHAELADSINNAGFCLLNAAGERITADNSADPCSASIECALPVTCRVTGGGTLVAGTVDQSCIPVETMIFPSSTPNGLTINKITHGGQMGAPFAQEDCGETLGNPCIRGQWQHTRHYQGKGNQRDIFDMNFHSNTPKGTFDSFMCACLGCCPTGDAESFVTGMTVGEICNPNDHKVCGPAPRPAPGNAIIFSGIGTLKASATDSRPGGNPKATEYVVFRVYIEDRSEPGGHHPKGGVAPADIYCFQAWRTGVLVSKKSDHSSVETELRRALGAANCQFLADLESGALPIGSMPSSTVMGRAADVVDCGPMLGGNHQIHPSTGSTCNE